jgi:hypothetical protein
MVLSFLTSALLLPVQVVGACCSPPAAHRPPIQKGKGVLITGNVNS